MTAMRYPKQQGFVHYLAMLAALLVIAICSWLAWQNHLAQTRAQQGGRAPAITSFDTCRAVHSSTIVMSYPEKCVTGDGRVYVQQADGSAAGHSAPPSGWKTYQSPYGKFSLSYPGNWVQPANQAACGSFLSRDLEIGPDSRSVISCGADGTVSQISVRSVDGDQRGAAQYVSLLQAQGYGNVSKTSVTASGVTGTELTGKAEHQQDSPGLGGLPDGTIVIEDVFYSGGITYIAAYTQKPAGSSDGPVTNQQTVFASIVRNYLHFD